ncbi:MAG: hypothetical protein SF123_21230 [Chloroflexota bacterium]|nr:hypothetical protein [Chloroflexota bacterium]
MQLTKNLPETKAGRIADFGILFSVLICLGIVAMGTWLLRYTLAVPGPNDDGFFYDWQLADPTFWGRASAWILFGVHQIAHWVTIWWAQERYEKYSDKMRPANWWALGINVVFIIAHYFQTMFFYDAIAQDIPSWTAQFAVIMMLFVIIAMENRRRGIFFGKKINFRAEFYEWMKRYHGYAFSFAVIYTFWFHPMVDTLGHLGGFVHVILVMVQGSIMMTRTHLNRKWTFLLEILVLPHAALVAWNQVNSGMPDMLIRMFTFGFLAIFIVTQMHGLGLKPWVKNVFGLSFLLAVFIVYLGAGNFGLANEVIRIPAIEYLMVFMMYGLWWLFAKFTGRLKGARADTYVEGRGTAAAVGAGD